MLKPGVTLAAFVATIYLSRAAYPCTPAMNGLNATRPPNGAVLPSNGQIVLFTKGRPIVVETGFAQVDLPEGPSSTYTLVPQGSGEVELNVTVGDDNKTLRFRRRNEADVEPPSPFEVNTRTFMAGGSTCQPEFQLFLSAEAEGLTDNRGIAFIELIHNGFVVQRVAINDESPSVSGPISESQDCFQIRAVDYAGNERTQDFCRPEDEVDSGGCQSTRSAAWPLVLLLFLGFRRRRQRVG